MFPALSIFIPHVHMEPIFPVGSFMILSAPRKAHYILFRQFHVGNSGRDRIT